tara:strand:+ start:2062 stop:2793 length:732 start_codon:yes stop_codon:yes gene_type:complete
MGVLGGLDVGFGANMQIVRTNYLVVNTSAQATTAEMARFLALYNTQATQNVNGNSGLTCDYVMSESHPPSDAATKTDPSVIETITGAAVPVANAHANANQPGYNVIAVLSVGAATLTANGQTGTAVASALNANADFANSDLLASLAGDEDGADNVLSTFADNVNKGEIATVNISELIGDITTLMDAGGAKVAVLAGATQLSDSGFVEKGNASGAAPVNFSQLSVANTSIAVVSVVTLMGTGFA